MKMHRKQRSKVSQLVIELSLGDITVMSLDNPARCCSGDGHLSAVHFTSAFVQSRNFVAIFIFYFTGVSTL